MLQLIIFSKSKTKIWCNFVVLIVTIYLFPAILLSAENPLNTMKKQQEILGQAIVKAETSHELDVKAELLAKTIKQQKREMAENLMPSALTLQMQQEMRKHIKPEMLVNAFMTQLDRIAVKHKGDIDFKSILNQCKQRKVEAAGGAIAGTITVQGAPPNRQFSVFAFDEHGYFSGETKVSDSTGVYRITDLSPGKYYVITWSHYFVDEIYPDQIAALGSFETWRAAQTVAVASGITTPDINFDLQVGTLLLCELFKTDGTRIENTATFEITEASSQSVILTKNEELQEAHYKIRLPGNGEYKISAQVEGFAKEWYLESPEWNAATPIPIYAGMDSIKDIKFTLAPDEDSQQTGTLIGGVSGPEGVRPGLFTTVGVFDTTDLSLVSLKLVISFFTLPSYTVENLEVGDYYVYANDYIGSLLGEEAGGVNYVGAFCESSLSLDGARVISVNAGQTAVGNIVLQQGGCISGQVIGPEKEPIDSLLVIAFQVNRDYGENDPWLTTLQYAFAVTNLNGNYKIIGLPAGKYAVRTLSVLPFDELDNEDITLPLPFPSGKHAGKFVDEYYGDVKSILDYESAKHVSVTVPNITDSINIQLDAVGFITGHVTAAESGNPIDDILILALNDTSGIPEFVFSEIDSIGYYTLGPLPSGYFKVLAVSGFHTRHQHLTEFYDGKRDFQEAAVIEVDAPYSNENINFTLDKGAVIQGFVDLDASSGVYHAGADTLDGVPVIAYDAASGKVASYDFVQFSGGFRIDRLLPGSYNLLVLPAMKPFASTYYGGGATFGDPKNNSVELEFGNVVDVNIELGTANGSIQGRILDINTLQPISMGMVIAYDSTGHPVGVAMTDFDLVTGNIISFDGSYSIEGLRSGTYFVRTFGFSSLLPMVEDILELADVKLEDILADPGDLLGLNLEAYADKWYNDVQDVLIVDLNELLINLTSFGIPSEHDQSLLPIYLPLPFFADIPSEATPVTVVDGVQTTNIDFALAIGRIEDIVSTSIEDISSEQQIPKEFAISNNYPNPFNPSTTFTISLPQKSYVDLAVYDLLGRRVRTLIQRDMQAGTYSSSWDGRDELGIVMSSGIYIIRLESGYQIKAMKISFVK